MTRIINLYGGPGTGKSTSAAYIFALMKWQGKNAELVREYVKDWAWEGRNINDYDQIYLLGKQIRRESMLYGKVTDIVTDSPIMLSAYYASKFAPPVIGRGVKELVKSFYDHAEAQGHHHVHVFLHRTKPYNNQGRYQTEVQAKEIDNELVDFFIGLNMSIVPSGTEPGQLENLLKNLDDCEKIR